jgi:hypothetical protein
MGKVVLCLSALVCLLVRAGAYFVFRFNGHLLTWGLQTRYLVASCALNCFVNSE